MQQYQMPQGPRAQADDERTKYEVVKAREAQTGKDAAVAIKSKALVDVKA